MKTKEAWFDEGNSALAIGELDQAETCYRAATEVDPSDVDVWHALAMIYYKQARYAESVDAGIHAAALDPNNQLVWTGLSMAHMKNNQIPEAEAAAAKAKVISWGGKIKSE